LSHLPELYSHSQCCLCPRMCRADRSTASGYCKAPDGILASRAALHFWEEPCISGTGGSGAIFFSGCTLRCCFCQNYKISRTPRGKSISSERLAEIFLELQDQGAHNINLVTATHYLPWILPALDMVKEKLHIPVVYNCGGYERLETIQALSSYVDIWLPDLKYFSSDLSRRYSQAPDYFARASAAVRQMILQTGTPVFDDRGIMQKGVIIRHLVLPGQKEDSLQLIKWMAEELPEKQFYISLLSQYTPYEKNPDFPELNRRITSYEYQKVVEAALEAGLEQGFMQKRTSAKEEYTPSFAYQGL
jgi:putative pyruvate formate lyase activating enzyme